VNRLKQLSRSQWIVTVSLLIVVLAIVWLMAWLMLGYTQYQRDMQNIEPRLARLAGLLEVEERLRSSEQLASAEVNNLVYNPSEESGALGAQMQKTVRELFASAGMSVTGTQILTAKADEQFTRVGIGINATGEMQSLETALMQIVEARPLVFLDRLEIQPERARRGRNVKQTQTVQVRVQLFSMRLNSP